jgi:hypothetical protein
MHPDSGRGGSSNSDEHPTVPGGFHLAPEIHAWLDGRGAAPARRGDAAEDVDFWRRLEGDIARRRQVRTPVHVQAAVMAAVTGSSRALVPWHRRTLRVSRGLVALGGAALLALGLALGIALG